MKQFIVDRHTTPNTPTLEQVPTDKIPIYDDIDAAAADLDYLTEGQIVATKDTGNELSQPVDAVESGNLHAVTSNAVYQSFKGMTVTECGYCNPSSDYKGWYIKYDNGLIEEYFVRSTSFSSMTALGSLYVVERTTTIPIPLKSGTTPQLVSGSIQSVYSSGKKSAWIACTNEGSDTNSIIYYEIISPLSGSVSNMVIRFHVVGFWK